MNYFNKTKKKRVPKLDRPNSSSLEFESLSRSLPLARFHELQRDGESFGDPKKPRKVLSFFRLDRIVLLLLLFSWLRITHNAMCVCVCVWLRKGSVCSRRTARVGGFRLAASTSAISREKSSTLLFFATLPLVGRRVQ